MNIWLNNISIYPDEYYPINGDICLFGSDDSEIYLKAVVKTPFISDVNTYKNSIIELKDIKILKNIDPLKQYVYYIYVNIENDPLIERIEINGRCTFNVATNKIEFIECEMGDDISNYALYIYEKSNIKNNICLNS